MNVQDPADDALGDLCRQVQQRLGLRCEAAQMQTLAETLRTQAGHAAQARMAWVSHLATLPGDSEAWRALAQSLTVGETSFLRHAEQFDAYASLALPRRLQAAGPLGRVRVLSAGCSTGEEPYTLALVTRERHAQDARRVSIHAMDVNPQSLTRAQAARYSPWVLRHLGEASRQRWFRPEGDAHVLDAELRSAVRFEWCNLAAANAAAWQPESWDIVFCRNMLMYLTPQRLREVVLRIERSLAPGGYLFLGHAETLRGVPGSMRLCHSHDCFYYQREPEGRAGFVPAGGLPEALALDGPAAAVETAATAEPASPWFDEVARAHARIGALAADARELAATLPVQPAQPVAHAAGRPAPQPDAADAHADHGTALEAMRSERFDLALRYLDELAARSPHAALDPQYLLLRATAMAHVGDWREAEAVCLRLLQQGTLRAEAHYVLALCRDSAGHVGQAIAEDRDAAALDSAFSMPRLHIGLLARRMGQPELAHAELTLAMKLLDAEDTRRLMLFGGGFDRAALVQLCRAEIAALAETA